MNIERIGTIFYNTIAGCGVILCGMGEGVAWGALALVAAFSQFYPDLVFAETVELHEDLTDGDKGDDDGTKPQG